MPHRFALSTTVPLVLKRRAGAGRGFSLIELLVVVAIIGLLIGILVPTLGGVRQRARRLKDQTQLRNIVQGLATWAGNNDGEYPLPSVLDRADATMATSESYQKDNTGNILSVMIYNNVTRPEVLVNPAEESPNIGVDTRFEFESPSGAADASRAVFDPGFAGVPLETGTGTGMGRRIDATLGAPRGGTSYAHVIPFGPRQGQWRVQSQDAKPLVADRGPEYLGQSGAWTLRPGPTGTGSVTLRIFGRTSEWRGNVAWNDGRVVFFQRPDPKPEMQFTFSGMSNPATRTDNIFANEDDENGAASQEQNPGANRNTFLRPYSDIQASGTRRSDARITTFID